MDNTKEFTAIEWCAGYGGIQLGLRRAIPNMRTIAYSEIEAFACANLVAKMEAGKLDAAPIWPDLKTFPNAEFYKKVDLLVAGYPCQPFSSAGKRGGDKDPRHLWPYIRDAIRLIQPRYCFFENVEGHISLGLSTVISDLEEDGYTTTWGIFSAEEVGAPHRRKRVFILAHNESWESGEQKTGDGRESSRGRSTEVNELAYGIGKGSQGHARDGAGSNQQGRITQEQNGSTCPGGLQFWPSRPGEPQHEWEPPRVVENTINLREHRRADVGSGGAGEQPDSEAEVSGGESEDRRTDYRAFEPPLGRDSNGLARGMDYAELCRTCDNRTDELRLLGNGVVPATAELAWRVLYERIRG